MATVQYELPIILTRNGPKTAAADYHPIILGWSYIIGHIRITYTNKAAAADDTFLHYFHMVASLELYICSLIAVSIRCVHCNGLRPFEVTKTNRARRLYPMEATPLCFPLLKRRFIGWPEDTSRNSNRAPTQRMDTKVHEGQVQCHPFSRGFRSSSDKNLCRKWWTRRKIALRRTGSHLHHFEHTGNKEPNKICSIIFF